MKRSRKCPKCGGSPIYYCPAEAYPAKDGMRFYVGSNLLFNTRIDLERYICAKCGYTEEYVSDQGLRKLAEAVEKGKIEKVN